MSLKLNRLLNNPLYDLNISKIILSFLKFEKELLNDLIEKLEPKRPLTSTYGIAYISEKTTKGVVNYTLSYNNEKYPPSRQLDLFDLMINTCLKKRRLPRKKETESAVRYYFKGFVVTIEIKGTAKSALMFIDPSWIQIINRPEDNRYSSGFRQDRERVESALGRIF